MTFRAPYPLALGLCVVLSTPTAMAISFVPPEACIDGEPIQVLNFAEMPLDDPRAREMARDAGDRQERGRRMTLVGLFSGVGLLVVGLTTTGVGVALSSVAGPGQITSSIGDLAADVDQETRIGKVPVFGLGLGVLGVGVTWGGATLGHRQLEVATVAADRALTLEEDATGRSVYWWADAEGCELD